MHWAGANVYGKDGINLIVSLLKGTNSEVDLNLSGAVRDKLLIARNTWFIAHPDYGPAKETGWHTGITGENYTFNVL